MENAKLKEQNEKLKAQNQALKNFIRGLQTEINIYSAKWEGKEC